MMNTKDTLFRLTNEYGGSGDEFRVSSLVCEMVKDLCDKVEVNNFGCVMAWKYSKNPDAKTIMFDAHIDQMAMAVTGITEDGFLRWKCHGFDHRQLYGADVMIDTKNHGMVPGVFNTVPVWQNDTERSKPVKEDDLTIDIGYPPEKVREMVSIGDYIYYGNETFEMVEGNICGRAMDDRAGAAAIIEALREMKDMDLPVNVVMSFTPREETGGPGAHLTGNMAKPDMAIAVDGTHAKCASYAGEGSYEFSAGAVISYGHHSPPEMSKMVQHVAKKYDIPHVVHLNTAHSGTNAGRIEYAALGIPTLVLEFPMRYAHASCEVSNIQNLETVANLIVKVCIEGGAIND